MAVICIPLTIVALLSYVSIGSEIMEDRNGWFMVALLIAAIAFGFDGAMLGGYIATHAMWVQP